MVAQAEFICRSSRCEYPIFVQCCPKCQMVRARKGTVWLPNEPDEGWYPWWPYEIAQRYGLFEPRRNEQIGVLHALCEQCLQCEGYPAQLQTLKSWFGTLSNLMTSPNFVKGVSR